MKTIDDWSLPRELQFVENLISSEGGLVQYASEISEPGEVTRLFATSMGKLEALHSNIRKIGNLETGAELGGAGGNPNPRLARAIAVVESLERYSSCVPPKDLPWASYNSIEEHAISIDQLPKCSENELSDPHAIAAAFDKDQPVRWTWAQDLQRERKVLVPAVLAWLHLPPLTSSERAWMQVSTGCAAHTTIEEALINGICEVVERDSIALTWLQKLRLKRLRLDSSDPRLVAVLDEIRATGRQYEFFDATTDLGVPTVYCLDTDPNDSELRTVVMAATDLDPVVAITKIVRETRSSRVALRNAPPPPADVADFTNVFHGAKLLGQAAHQDAFAFLREGERETVDLATLVVTPGSSSTVKLRWLLRMLTNAGCTVLAVDLTTAEARLAGIHVVRVIIPELMPLTFVHQVRYLAHPRLYTAPLKMGLESRTEDDINPLPQPFA